MDDWMLQNDTRSLLETSPVDDEGFIVVYEKRESHIERRFVLLNPLPRRHCLASLKRDHMFGEDTSRVRFPVVRHVGSILRELRLTPRFFKYASKSGIDAGLADDDSTLFDWTRNVSGGTSVTRFRIKLHVLENDLKKHNLLGLWCIDSMRFSEKSLADLDLKSTRKTFQSGHYRYELLLGHRPQFRFRMLTLSVVMGKRILTV
jgi:hypothetical protein